jgi:hypothetical protein
MRLYILNTIAVCLWRHPNCDVSYHFSPFYARIVPCYTSLFCLEHEVLSMSNLVSSEGRTNQISTPNVRLRVDGKLKEQSVCLWSVSIT